ncbi:hypothetical protein GH714_006111 [Hevea brasiliensis]|uniref:Uncharacterized protein n=1 Tax=Hevea brasiliensis TaxID=3981 RepID=A0A6A6MBY1_HEVBR|nr:hypothetical protein GH714_006111 [Hevea brasiliensis]
MAVAHDNKDSFIFKLTKDCLSNWELPNDVLQLLNMVLLDVVVLHVGRPQPHQWTIGIGRGENGNMVQFKEMMERRFLMGPHPVEDLVYISSNDEYEAARSRDWVIARGILKEHPKVVKASINKQGKTALHIATAANHTHFVEQLIDMNEECLEDRNLAMIPVRENVLPIHIAALLGHGKMVRYLYEETKYQLQNIEIVDLTALLVALINSDMYGEQSFIATYVSILHA